jgi:hypothetical protein
MERIVITALCVSEQQISRLMDGVVMTVWAILYTTFCTDLVYSVLRIQSSHRPGI